MHRLYEALERGQILSTKAWMKALPHFGSGHMEHVAKYRSRLGESGHMYLGQALFGRSIAMVLPGVMQELNKIKAVIKKAQQRVQLRSRRCEAAVSSTF